MLEDILNTDQRPKLDDYGDYLFIILKMLHPRRGRPEVITGADQPHRRATTTSSPSRKTTQDVFDIIRERLKAGKGRIRKERADYLAYALLDLIVDHYFLVLEDLGEVVEDLEEELVTNPTPATLSKIYRLKRDT